MADKKEKKTTKKDAKKELTPWMKLVMEMKAKHNCSLKEAMVYAKKEYKK